ncbi:TetR/AcrR family transcriptional regulator [Oceanicoccus sagamiensis]|nr:TetR/AcrR family transcriptional regulator [Oceanicoccus sagamiensis]
MITTTEQKAKTRPNEGLILASALDCFTRYGYQRTSMSDIATAAGLSRTALYKYYKNKEQVFKALSQQAHDRVAAAIIEAAQLDDSLQNRLFAIIEARLVWFFEMLSSGPHGRELIDQSHRAIGTIGATANKRFVKRIASLLKEGEQAGELDLSAEGVSADAIAAILVDSSDGIIVDASTEKAARKRVRLLVNVIWAGIEK